MSRCYYEYPPLTMPLTVHPPALPPDFPTSPIERHRSNFNLPVVTLPILSKLALVLLAFITFFIMVYFPLPPKVDLVSTEFHPHSLTGFEISSGWNVSFALSNPRGGSYYSFNDVVVIVSPTKSGPNDRLAVSHIVKLDLSESGGTGNQIIVQSRLLSPAQFLDNDVLMGFIMDRASGFVRFDVKISMNAWYKPLLIGPQFISSRAVCSGVKFEFADAEGKDGIAKIEPNLCYLTIWDI